MFNVLLRILFLLSWSCCWLSALFYLMQWVVLPLPPASHWDVRPGSVNSTLTTEQTSSTTDTSEGWVELRAWWDRTHSALILQSDHFTSHRNSRRMRAQTTREHSQPVNTWMTTRKPSFLRIISSPSRPSLFSTLWTAPHCTVDAVKRKSSRPEDFTILPFPVSALTACPTFQRAGSPAPVRYSL